MTLTRRCVQGSCICLVRTFIDFSQKQMKLLKVLSLFITILTFTACSDDDNDGNSETSGNANKNAAQYAALQFPKAKGGDSDIITHSTSDYGDTYSFEWDHKLKAQRWTCYYFTSKNNKKNWSRNQWYGASWDGRTWNGDPFQKDPLVPDREQPSVTGEFSGSSFPDKGFSYFQRGHICASEDRMVSKEANGQTFYMTNMMPQGELFNGKLWSKMEAFVRDKWGRKITGNDTLFVVKGGTIDKESQILCRTRSGFIVPRYFFMALLLKRNNSYQAMGFYVEHINSDQSGDALTSYTYNIDALEEKTGIDFFCNLPDVEEDAVEKQDLTVIKRLWDL